MFFNYLVRLVRVMCRTSSLRNQAREPQYLIQSLEGIQCFIQHKEIRPTEMYLILILCEFLIKCRKIDIDGLGFKQNVSKFYEF